MKIAHGTIVLAADGEKALLFRNEGDEKYSLLQTLAHEEVADPATRDIGSDRPGRSFASVGDRRSGYGDNDWHRQTEDHFAGRAAELLEQATQGNDANLVIVAAPRFLGALRSCLPDKVRGRVIAEIDKDFAHRKTDDLAAAIADFDPRSR